MNSPREPDDFDDGSGRPWNGDGSWHEPAHLGEGATGSGGSGGSAGSPEESSSWEPPGWSLPAAQGDGPNVAADWSAAEAAEAAARAALAEDPLGLRAWAVQRGWTVSDGTGAADAALGELLAAGPLRLGREHRPHGVLRGRHGSLDLVAFDVVHPLGRRLVFQYAVTAAPLLGAVPALRLSPARLWKHRTAGLVRVPSGDADFDARWMLLAAEDGPQARHLVEDPTVRGLLLGSDDGDEFWTALVRTGGGTGHFLAAVRPDAHRPLLLEHHARLLAALVAALAAGAF